MKIDPTLLLTGGVEILVLLLAISVHESAHAWMAERCGDPTARMLGRVTLNPLKHLDLFGSIILPILLILAHAPVFGWAKPTPVLVRNLKRPRRDDILVSAAGPVSNFLLATAGTIVLAVVVRSLGPAAQRAARLTLLNQFSVAAHYANFPLVFFLVELAFLNAFLGLFNLLPIPPLDGGQIVLNLLPPDWAARYDRIRPFGFLIVIGLAVLNLLSFLLIPVYVILAFAIGF